MKEEILEVGSYDLTFEELEYGCNLAWRNEPRCPARIQWQNLVRMKICHCMVKILHIFPTFYTVTNHIIWFNCKLGYFQLRYASTDEMLTTLQRCLRQ